MNTEDVPVQSRKYKALHAFAFLLVMAGTAVAFYKMPLSITKNFKADTPQTYTVTNTNDSGAGSLRTAITNANSNAAGDTIAFSVSGTITLSSTLQFAVRSIFMDKFLMNARGTRNQSQIL